MSTKPNSVSYTPEEIERIQTRVKSLYDTYIVSIETDMDKHRRLQYHSENREEAERYNKILKRDEIALEHVKEEYDFLKAVGAVV